MTDLTYFVFTVASVVRNTDNYFPSKFLSRERDKLEKFNDAIIPDILTKLGNEQARLAANPDNLILKDFLIYAGSGRNSEIPLRELPEWDSDDRYGRVLFVGLAAGKDIFNTLPGDPQQAQSQRQRDEKRFNCFLDEIFGTEIVIEGASTQYKEIEDYGDCENRPTGPNNPDIPWEAGWTIFRVDETYNFADGVMAGHGC